MIYAKDVEGEYVLIVENDLMLLATTQSLLTEQGYAIASCSTPEEALRMVDEYPRARVVFTRVIFPDSKLTGVSVAGHAHQGCRAAAVFTDHLDAALLYTLPGFDEHAFLPQPYTPRQVLGAIAEAWWSGERGSTPPKKEEATEPGDRFGAGRTRHWPAPPIG